MNLDALLRHYLGADDPTDSDAMTVEDAAGRIAIDFGVERDPGRRFALWALLDMLGRAPDPDIAFKDRGERSAAHDLARLMAKADDAG